MAETKWTPGPWIADDFCMQSGRQVRVGTTDGTPHYYHRTASICEAYVKHPALGDEMDPGEPAIGVVTAEANARLIAAAPDLYEACAALRQHLQLFTGPDDAIANATLAMADAALAKAKSGVPSGSREPTNGNGE